MKPIVSAMHAWTCTVISVFAIVILSILGGLYRSNHEEFVGGEGEPEDGKAVASTIFSAVFVYIAFFVFCGLQGMLHVRESRRGAISL
jgi:ribonuclease kappa